MTIGELTDKAVEKTLTNKSFLKFAEEKKSVSRGWTIGANNTEARPFQNSGWASSGSQVGPSLQSLF